MTATVKDKTVTIVVPLKALNKKLALGTPLSGMHADDRRHLRGDGELQDRRLRVSAG